MTWRRWKRRGNGCIPGASGERSPADIVTLALGHVSDFQVTDLCDLLCAALSMKFVGICYRSTGKRETWKDTRQYGTLIVFKKVGGIRLCVCSLIFSRFHYENQN